MLLKSLPDLLGPILVFVYQSLFIKFPHSITFKPILFCIILKINVNKKNNN